MKYSLVASLFKPLLLFSLLTVIGCSSDTKGDLEVEVQTIELQYIAWACDCANWASPEDIELFHHNEEDTLAKLCVFVEPAPGVEELPDSISYPRDLVRFTGRFYSGKGFPDSYHSFQDPAPARVFQYTDFEVLKSHKHEYVAGL